MAALLARFVEECMSDFGARLQKEINRVGLNQRQVSIKSGLDYPFLNKIIKKNQAVTLDTLVKLLSVQQLKPFLVDEIYQRSPELFSPETIAIIKRAHQELSEKLDAHGPEEVLRALQEEQERRA